MGGSCGADVGRFRIRVADTSSKDHPFAIRHWARELKVIWDMPSSDWARRLEEVHHTDARAGGLTTKLLYLLGGC